MELRLGHDLGAVRVHRDSAAAHSARVEGALAYAVGRDLVFGAGQYAPHTPVGRKLLAHELTHAVQQNFAAAPPFVAANGPAAVEAEAARAAEAVSAGHSFRPVLRAAPHVARQHGSTTTDIIPENPYDAEIRAHEFSRLTISIVRDPILQALRRGDSITFLNRLRALDAEDREILRNDTAFLDEIHHTLHGLSFFIVLCTLRYGQSLPINLRRLQNALFGRDGQQVADLLRAFPELRNEADAPGAAEAIDWQFRGNQAHDLLLRIYREAETQRIERGATPYLEIHYESTGLFSQALQTFGGTENYALARTASELRVIVRIHLVNARRPAETYYPSNAIMSRWRSGIQGIWNNRFSLTNGTATLRLVFDPVFTEQNPHHTVKVDPRDGRSDEGTWYENDSDPLTVPHEFGHMLGNPDEYNLPGSMAEIPASAGLSPAEQRRSSWEGIYGRARPQSSGGYDAPGSIMSSGRTVERRHVQNILGFFNAHLSSGEAPFRLA